MVGGTELAKFCENRFCHDLKKNKKMNFNFDFSIIAFLTDTFLGAQKTIHLVSMNYVDCFEQEIEKITKIKIWHWRFEEEKIISFPWLEAVAFLRFRDLM